MIPRYPGSDVEREHTESIEDVPVYRREWFASVLVLAGFFCCPPLLWWVCVLCLTGDIYRNKLGPDGKLRRWSRANKVAAVVILMLQFLGIAWRLDQMTNRSAREPPIPLAPRGRA